MRKSAYSTHEYCNTGTIQLMNTANLHATQLTLIMTALKQISLLIFSLDLDGCKHTAMRVHESTSVGGTAIASSSQIAVITSFRAVLLTPKVLVVKANESPISGMYNAILPPSPL